MSRLYLGTATSTVTPDTDTDTGTEAPEAPFAAITPDSKASLWRCVSAVHGTQVQTEPDGLDTCLGGICWRHVMGIKLQSIHYPPSLTSGPADLKVN